MNRIFFISLVIFLVLPATVGAVEPDFRGLWVHNWKPGLLNPAEVESTVKWAKECNFNVIIAQVRKAGDAYYDSAYEPRADNITGPSDFDSLNCVITHARANGLGVYAWVNVFRVLTPNIDVPPNHVTVIHPEWLSKDVNGKTNSPDGTYLDPGVPEVREYIVMLIRDILSKYNVDGIMLDYIRYPGKNWGYNKKAVAIFNSEYGRTGVPEPDDPAWCDWRRKQVTETVRAIYNAIAQQKPYVGLSAATVTWGKCPWDFRESSAYSKVFQDWRSWMQEGILDANMLMNYKNPSITQQNIAYAGWLIGAKRWAYGRHVYSGVMVYGNNTTGAATQIRSAQRRGLPGVVGFSFSQTAFRNSLAYRLKKMVFSSPAPVPIMPWKHPGVITVDRCEPNESCLAP